MPSRPRKSPASFVERHNLWTPAQEKAAAGIERAIKSQKLELVRFSFADQHGVLRGKTLLASEVASALRNGVTMTTTLLAKDTSHKSVFPVFTAGGGFDMPEMQGGADFVMVADPATFRVLPWADKTGWVLCDMFFGNGKPVPFSTRAICRDALGDLEQGRLRLHGRAGSRIPSVQNRKPAAQPRRRDLAAASAGRQPAEPRLPISHRVALRHARSGDCNSTPRHRGARTAIALSRDRTRAQPGRIYLSSADGIGRRRQHDPVSLGDKTDRAP